MSYTDKDAWFTPRSILDELGKFDLDPANSTPENHPTADKHFGPAEDGLIQDWTGRVWLNPPFSNARPFIEKLIEHGDGIALVFCRVDALWFQKAAAAADLVLFIAGRISFVRPDGKLSRCPLGCVLLAFGVSNAAVLSNAKIKGLLMRPQK